MNRNVYKKAQLVGKGLLAKAKKNFKKYPQRKTAGKKKSLIEDAEEFKVDPMVGKTVRVIVDCGDLGCIGVYYVSLLLGSGVHRRVVTLTCETHPSSFELLGSIRGCSGCYVKVALYI